MTAVAPPILETTGLKAGYFEVNILHDVSIAVPRGAIVSVIGPNGAGKSTLLKTIYGFLKPRDGRVVYRPDGAEHDITGLRPNRVTALGLSYIPQLDNVFPNMSIQENLEMGAFLLRTGVDERLERMFELFPLLRERRRAKAGGLSGGQRQMLAMARALMSGPDLLLLDEPSAGLAPNVVDEVFDKIREINAAGISMIIVEQNARRSLAMSDYGYVLDMGRNRFEGPGERLLHDEKVVDLYLGGRGRLAAAAPSGEDYEAAERPPPPAQRRFRL
ncbi:MAG: ABC transporter ATP-binding protein [Thermoleophilia bacterium]|nr:ABC transporter ATP-binding protein [Thermoleophilia bacterium]